MCSNILVDIGFKPYNAISYIGSSCISVSCDLQLLTGKNSDELVVAAIALLTGAAKSTSDMGGVRWV